jgi:hypothetical protein
MNPSNPTPPPNGGSKDSKGPNGPSAKESARIIALLEAHANVQMQLREQILAAEKTHSTLSEIEVEVKALRESNRHLTMLDLGPRVTILERAAPPKQSGSEPRHSVSRKEVLVWASVVFVVATAIIAFSIERVSAAHDRDSAHIAALEVRLQELNQRQDMVVRDFHRLLDAFVAQRGQP